MIAEFGHFALVLALFAALAQTALGALGASRAWADHMAFSARAAITQFALIAVSFATLTIVFVNSDFSVALVARHSHSAKPLLYKISGVWGNHEGSMLLWVLILALFGAAVALFGRNLPSTLKAWTLATQGGVGVLFLAFVLLTSNPFERLARPPFEGADLNPLLQDPGLAFHPPFLYLGYVGLSTVFAFAIAALIEGRVDGAWGRWVRPWTLAAWIFLTIGIALGSYWAYYELGWGGWWFWDPVENASFMPWLVAGALFHSAIVVEKRGELKSWTILLAILAFGLSLLGTFLVRSGVLNSVHAFANDPERGKFILFILIATVGGALALYAHRATKLASSGVFAPISRESALLFNNLILTVCTIAVLVGTLAPIAYAAAGKTITVGPPFFDWVFGLLMGVLMLVLPIGAMLPWKRGDAVVVMKKLSFVAAAVITCLAISWALMRDVSPLAPIGIGFAFWVIAGAVYDLLARARFARVGAAVGFQRLAALPRAEWGKFCGHAGLGLTTFGVALSIALETETMTLAKPGDQVALGGYVFVFQGVVSRPGPNYDLRVGQIDVVANGKLQETLTPQRRFYQAQRIWTSEVALSEGLTRDLYAVLGEQRDDGRWAIRLYHKPFIAWIWLGSLVMAIGGALSLADRRCRVGAPASRRRPVTSAMAPAE
jgi:cytochrome c-type biogenesis protein CcmF